MIPDLKYLKPERNLDKYRVSIHACGDLTFSTKAKELLNLPIQECMILAHSKESTGNGDLYIIPRSTKDERGFELRSRNGYFYIKAKAIFDKIGIDYKGAVSIAYNVVDTEETYNDMHVYKLIRYEVKKRKKNATLTTKKGD